MSIPWYIYLIAIVLALPIWILCVVGIYLVGRLLLSWIVADGSTGESKAKA